MLIRSLLLAIPLSMLSVPALADPDPACIERCEDVESRTVRSCRMMMTENEAEKSRCEGSANLERMSCESSCPEVAKAPKTKAPATE